MKEISEKTAIHVEQGAWSELQTDAMPVRMQVFVQEQGVPADLEADEQDASSLHAVAYDENGLAIGTGRLLPDGHLGRMAVLPPWRGRGVGALLMQSLLAQARQQGMTALMLSAQSHARAFYERFGFVVQGQEYLEVGLPHVHMRLNLTAMQA